MWRDKTFFLFLIALYTLISMSRGAQAVTYTNSMLITVPASGTQGIASPYPSTISVSGLVGSVTDVNVTIHGFSHTEIADVDILLVGPTGQTVMLMRWVGSGSVVNATYTFDDAASSSMPFTGVPASGTYKPTTFARPGSPNFSAPAPAGPYGTTLSSLNALNPNGNWQLYVQDFARFDTGSIANGWTLELLGVTPVPEPSPLATLMGLVLLGGVHRFRPTFQHCCPYQRGSG